MRLLIQIKLETPLTLPLNYQDALQGFIYNQIEDKAFSHFLHEEGYLFGKRRFKLFTYSRLFGKPIVDSKRKTITFQEKVSWQVSSCLPKFIQEFGQNLLMKEYLHFNGQPITIQEISYKNLTVEKNKCTIKMLSPITVHSTFISTDGKKTTQYYRPYDPAFTHLINENLHKKFTAYYNKPLNKTLDIKPLQVSKKDKVVTRFKGFIIEGWNGIYSLQGDPDVLTFACTAGLGGRNSSGFGLPEIVSS